MNSHVVAVYGAGGHTGQFVAAELERRGVAVRRVARSVPAESLVDQSVGQASWMRASCDEPDALDRALRGVDAVINCAGPFQDTAPAVIEAALRARAHYFDIAAEQRSVRQSLATFYEEALDKGLVVVPAMAFYGGLADLLVGQVCSGLAVVDKILIGVALDSWHPTLGTRRTGDRNTARRVIVANGRLSPLPSPGPRGQWRFPQPFGELPVSSVPLSEVITISRHVKANQIESFMNEAPLADLNNAKTPSPTSVDGSGKSPQTFVMDVFASGDGQSRRLAASGRDIYAISAPLIVEACLRVLSDPPTKGGSFAPAELFDPQEFLSSLAPDLRVESMNDSCPLHSD